VVSDETLLDQMPHALLPPNATPFERAIADLAPRLELDELAESPRGVKWNPPDAYLPWLASEWFLSGFVKYFPTLRDLIDHGLPWLMERGTAAAVKEALSWIGIEVARVEEDGAYLQLDTGRVIAPDELHDLVYLVLQSIPAHVDLYRLYHDYDLRMIRTDEPERLDDGLLEDDSGVWVNVDGKDIKLSFALRFKRRIYANEHRVLSNAVESYMMRARYSDRWLLDHSELDTPPVRNYKITDGQLLSLQTRPLDNPRSLGRMLTIPKSALALDDDTRLDNLNAGFAGGYDLTWNPMRLDGGMPDDSGNPEGLPYPAQRLDDIDPDTRHYFIDERIEESLGKSEFKISPQVAQRVAVTSISSSWARRGHSSTIWRGKWDSRKWIDSVNLFPIKMTETSEPMPDESYSPPSL
jgi:hypothetical protein